MNFHIGDMSDVDIGSPLIAAVRSLGEETFFDEWTATEQLGTNLFKIVRPGMRDSMLRIIKTEHSEAPHCIEKIKSLKKMKDVGNIVEIEDYCSVGDYILSKTEFLQSVPDSLSEQEIVRMIKEVSSALTLCHAQGIIHNNINPSNIFLSNDNTYKLGVFSAKSC